MKRLNKRYWLFFILFFILWNIHGQDSTRVDKFHLKGYMKFLSVGINSELLNTFLSEQYFHNRLMAEWEPVKNLEVHAALRARFFYGSLLKVIPGFGESISKNANDYFDLDWLIIDNEKYTFHTVLDRLYIQYNISKWEIAAGRQRINWGIATLWNPNDVFNIYNFTDFDYEERPGSDALRITWYKNWNTSVEVAAKMADSLQASVIATRVKFGIGTYDIQGILGNYYDNLAIGGGFAGNLWNGSLKGEFTFFLPWEGKDKDLTFAGTVEYQRFTSFDLFYTVGFLYNSTGTGQSIVNLFTYQPSAQNIYPYKYSAFIQGTYTITPLLTSGLAVVYSFNENHPMFISPTITYSAAQNFDVSLTGQIMAENSASGKPYKSPLQAFYLRFKYSF